MVWDMGFVETVKEFIGFGDIEDEEEFEEMEQEERIEPSHSFRKNKVVALNSAQTQRIVIVKPKCFSNSTEVADELKRNRPVVIDVGALDPDEARRVVDFVAGTVYGVNGSMQKVSGGIFIATPSQVDIMGEILKDAENGGFEWSMF